ncbi:YhbY family RNA-binding protein [Candidatus Woesearchaeota archaeon]|nr:YhbY family RNA-binding protein [Candidatus Woesearchaeota archaeon]
MKPDYTDKAFLRIGKNGLTEGAVREISIQLKKRGVIRIKILKSAMSTGNKDDLIKKCLQSTKAELISSIGNTFTIRYKKAQAKGD